MFVFAGWLCSVAVSQGVRAGDTPALPDLKGPLVVHLGCGDGKMLAELAGQGQLLVHGFDTDAANVAKARDILRAKGIYGRATAQVLTGANLPYAENMVNAMVITDPGGVTDAEAMRVLVPGGVVWRLRDGKWVRTLKPWPADIDEWTHWLHGADCNAVARDKVAGAPRRMKWIAGPLWSRHHNTVPSVTAMVTAGGRIFSIVDEAPSGMGGSAPDKWVLVARDAFNGLELWRKPMDMWGWKAWSDEWTCRFTIPTHIPRRLVAVGDRVYVTLGFNAPLTELDAATGEVLRTFKGTDFTDEILCDKGLLIVSLNQAAQHPGSGSKQRKGLPAEPTVKKSVAAIDVASGKMLWKKGDFEGLHSKRGSMDRISHLSMCSGGGRIFFVDRDKIVALKLTDGSVAWRAPRPEVPEHKLRYNIRLNDMCSLVYAGDMVYFAQLNPDKRVGWREVRGKLHAFSAKTGKEMWSRICSSWGWGAPADIFCLQGLVWVHDFENPFILGLDPATGEFRRKVSNEKAFDNGHHHRCYRNKATERFMITSFRGLEFIDWTGSAETSLNHWIRGVCRLGVMPANGLVYATPDPCECYISSKINGFVALAGKGDSAKAAASAERLVRGPAYGAKVKAASATSAGDWPTYRHDPERSGSASCPAPAKPVSKWRSDLRARPTACTAAGDVVCTAVSHEVVALDAETGKCRWRFTAGGRVDAPPTIAGGLVIFGSADGWAYCLRGADGELVWRFRGAPTERLIGAFDGVESAWPVHGCVLVRKGVAYFTAGRSSFLDGGIFAYGLDVRTGKVVSERRIASDHDMKVGKGQDRLGDTGLLDDILVAGPRGVQMRRFLLFGDANTPADGPAVRSTGPGGMLADTWNPRERWYMGDKSCAEYCVFDTRGVYGIRAREDVSGYGGFFEPGQAGYELFAADLPLKVAGKGKKISKRWSIRLPVKVTAMVIAGDVLLAAGTPDAIDPKEPWAAYEGRRGGVLLTISATDGKILSRRKLHAAPIPDGLTLAGGRLLVTTSDGKIQCFR